MRSSAPKAAATRSEILVILGVVLVAVVLFSSIATPGSSAQRNPQQNKALQQARTIYHAMKMFAADHNGKFPSVAEEDFDPAEPHRPLLDANRAFANVTAYLPAPNEHLFSVPDSAYCQTANGKMIFASDSLPADRTKILPPGHNHWAYVLGLEDDSNANFPILADGFSGGPGPVTNPAYAKSKNQYGGAREGRSAIIIRCDGSASVVPVNQTSLTMIRPGMKGGNLFTPGTDPSDPWLKGCTVLNPLQNH